MALTKRQVGYGNGQHQIDSREWVLYSLPAVLMKDLLALFRAPGYRPPALPAVALELLTLSRKPEVTYAQVLHLVQQDPMIAARVLKVAQSPGFAGRRPIPSLQDAIVRLGIRRLSDLFLEAAMSLRVFRCASYEAPMSQLMKHSTAVAHAANLVSRRTTYPTDYAFLIGLMHDVGAAAAIHLIAERGKPGVALPVFDEVKDAIREVHAQGSARLAEIWGLPPDVQTVLESHHEPRVHGAVHPMIAVLRVAEHIVSPISPAPHEADAAEDALRISMEALDLTDEHVRQLGAELAELLAKMS